MARIEFVDSVRRQGACGTWSAIMLRDGSRCSAMRLPVLVTDRSAIGRIVSSTRALVRANIPGVAPVADVAVGGDQVWIFVGIAPGPSVADLLLDVALSPADAALVAVDAGEVLAALHGNGMRHGSFGAETIVVSRSGEVRVTEAGLAHALVPRDAEDPGEAARADVKAWADTVRALAAHVRIGGHRGAAEALEECAQISQVGGLASALSALDRAGFDFPGFPSRAGLRDTMSRYALEDEPSTEKIMSAIDALFSSDEPAARAASQATTTSPASTTPNRGPATPPRGTSAIPTNAARTAPVSGPPAVAPTSPAAGGSPAPTGPAAPTPVAPAPRAPEPASAAPQQAGATPAQPMPAGTTTNGAMPAGSAPNGSTPHGTAPAPTAPGGTTPGGTAPAGSVPPGSVPPGNAPTEAPPADGSRNAEADRPSSPAPVGAPSPRGPHITTEDDGTRETVGLAPVSPTRADMPSTNGSGGRHPAGGAPGPGSPRPSLFTPSAANMAAAAKAAVETAPPFVPPAAPAPGPTTDRPRRTTPIPLAATGTSVPAPPRPAPEATPTAAAPAPAPVKTPPKVPATPIPASRVPAGERETVRTAPAPSAPRPATLPRPVSVPPAAPPAPRPSVAGPSALVHTVRFGSGVPTQPKSRPAPARLGRLRRWPRVLANLALAVVLLGGVGFFVASQLHDPLHVTGVTLTVNKHLGTQCELDADVVGTITTTGGPGVLTYQWQRSDGTATDVYTNRVGGSSAPTIVHLHWVFRGTGQETADVTLSILGPESSQATTSFNYICAG